MAEQDKEQKLEQLLDSMLRDYSAVEPRPGLETRILARLREVPARRRWWSIVPVWAWAGGAVAVALLAAMVFRPAKPVVQPSPAQAEAIKRSPGPPAPGTAATSHKTEHRQARMLQRIRKSHVKVADKRPDVFPTPEPLSEQEKLMFAYLANTPHDEVVSQIQSNDQKEAAEFWADREPVSSGGTEAGDYSMRR